MPGFGSFSNPQGSSGSFGSFNSSGNVDLNSSQGLLSLAQMQGGQIEQAANELAHPTTNILSAIGDGFKNAFGGFVKVISTPSEFVAGTITSLKDGTPIVQNIQDAMKNATSPAEALFGKEDPNAGGLQKVGQFLTRTAVNVLLDPLTYVTFGAGEGLLGLRATTELTLDKGGIAAAKLGKIGGESTVNLNKAGQGVYGYLSKLQDQITGDTAFKIAKTGDTTLDLAGEELAKVLKGTVDSPLNPDFARMAMAKLLEVSPGLTETLLDKGGIKFFGQSILSGQRIASTVGLIPGMTKLDELTKPVRNIISAPFDTSMIKTNSGWTRLPPEYIDSFQNYKDLAGSWADKNVGNIADIIKANNLIPTEGKFLMAAIEAGYKPADARLANAWNQFFHLGEDQYNMMKAAGIPVGYLQNYAPHMLIKEPTSMLAFKMPPSQKVGAAIKREMDGPIYNIAPTKEGLGAVEANLVKGNNKAAEEMLANAKNEGFHIFDDNIATAWIQRTMDNTRGTTARYFMKNIAESFGIPESIGRQKGYTTISSAGIKNASDEFTNRVFGEAGEAMTYHPAIAKHVENFLGSVINDDAMSELGKHFDSLQNLWKASVTSIFPAFHGRNAISNVIQNYLDMGVHAFNPVYHYVAGHMVLMDRQATKLGLDAMKPGATEESKTALADLLKTPMFTDTTGNTWTFGELRRVAKDHNIAFTSRITSSIDSAQGPAGIAKGIFEEPLAKRIVKGALPISQEFLGFKGGRALGNAIEEQGRLLNFTANLRNTGDVTLAAKRTKQFLFDYGNLTNFEKVVMKRLLPFYTYTRKNIELQVRALATTPGRISAQVQALSTLGEVISGGNTLSQDEQNALPDWVKSGISILAQKKGNEITLLSSLGTPIEQPFQALQPNQMLGSISPLIRLPFEQASGYSLYQGKPLSEVTNAAAFKKAPKIIQDLIGFTKIDGHRSDGSSFTWYTSLHPEMMNLILNLPPTTRVFSALKQMDAADVTDQAKLVQQLVGVRPYSFDLDQEAQKRENELKAKLQTLLTNAGVTAQFTRTYIPKI